MKFWEILNKINLKMKRFIVAHYLKLRYGKRITIGSNLKTRRRFNCLVLENGCLKIGANVFFNNDCSVNVLGNTTIGDNVIFGEGVRIYDHNHRFKIRGGGI